MGKGVKKSKLRDKVDKPEPDVTSALIIDEKGANLGHMNVAEARALAASQGMTLVLVSEVV